VQQKVENGKWKVLSIEIKMQITGRLSKRTEMERGASSPHERKRKNGGID
jgi:hypothetical protein